MPSTLTDVLTLDPGQSIPLIAGATVAGTAKSQLFCVRERPGGGDRDLELSAVGVGGVPTTVTADLEVSSDGGATFNKQVTGLALVAAGVATDAQVKNLVAGLVYRVNITTLTLGGPPPTAAGINGAVS